MIVRFALLCKYVAEGKTRVVILRTVNISVCISTVVNDDVE